MKYRKIIEKIESKSMSRTDLKNLKRNAQEKYSQGDLEAKEVLDRINYAEPKDTYILFMGFCPNADFSNRLDIKWKEKGICQFGYLESEVQANKFNTICKGDLVVLKKREIFGKTMKLYGHGRVKGINYDENNIRYLEMNWSHQEEIIEVPLMGANSTVDIKSMTLVEEQMPDSFFSWLGKEH